MSEVMNILYIEDNAANTMLMHKIIGRLPEYKLYDSVDAETGLEMMETIKPKIVLMDIGLPGMNGIQALKEIRKRFSFAKETPVIAVSADVMPDHIEAGIEQGFFDYITKPLDISKLLVCLEVAANVSR